MSIGILNLVSGDSCSRGCSHSILERRNSYSCGGSHSILKQSNSGIGSKRIDYKPYEDLDKIKQKLDKLEKSNSKLPRADRFTVEKSHQVGRHLVLMLKYSNCSNYEGRKVLVYRNTTLSKLLKTNNGLIDPHFSDNTNFIHPDARFVPTKDGLQKAIRFARSIL